MNPYKEIAIRALKQMMGNDAVHARAAFRSYTPEQMQQKHGQSEKTRAQVLAEYEKREAAIRSAIDWVTAQAD